MIAAVAVGTVCGVWFALSVLNQFHRGKAIARVKKHDRLALIPTWTFFAPRPGVTDFHVVYRDCSAAGGLSRWQELPVRRGGLLRAWWNPGKRLGKGITDTCNTVLRLAAVDRGPRLALNLPYLLLLNHVTGAPCTDASRLRQFAIVRTAGCDAPRDTAMVFVSALHRLPS